MTSPLPRTPQNRPTPVASKVAPATTAPATRAPKVSPETLGAGLVRSSLNNPRERMLLAGDTNSGKSYAWIQIAQYHYDLDDGVQFYMLDTDDTAPTFFAPGYEFEHLYVENGGNVHVFYAPDWPQIAKISNHITREAKRDDWIIVDLASSAYMLAQEFIADMRGLQLDDEVVARMVGWGSERKKGFGAFDGDTWGIVTRTYEASMRPLVNNARGANFIGLAHVTEMQTSAGRELREPILLFDQLGLKPTGVGKLVKMVNTCVILWSVRPMNEKNVSEPTIVRNMTVVKDRSEACHYTRPSSNFYNDLQVFRRTVTKTQNVVDPEVAAAALEAARNAINPPSPAESENPDANTTTDPAPEAN